MITDTVPALLYFILHSGWLFVLALFASPCAANVTSRREVEFVEAFWNLKKLAEIER